MPECFKENIEPSTSAKFYSKTMYYEEFDKNLVFEVIKV